MSRSFLKLVDYSLLPALALVLAKTLGVVMTAKIFGIDVSFKEYSNSLFSISPEVVSASELRIIASYSDLFAYVVIAGIFSFIVIKAVFLHDSHIKPTLYARLANQNLLHLVVSSYEIYHSALIALIFTWIMNILILVNVFSGSTFGWIGIATTFTSIVLSVILLNDVYKEVENIKSKPGQYTWA